MKGIENIVAQLESEAKAELDALSAETRASCDALKAEFQAKADGEYAARMKAGQALCAQREERLASAADMESRKALLSFKQTLVSEVFQKAVERLAGLPEEEYVAFLSAQAAKAALTGEEALIFNARDAETVGQKVAYAANVALGVRGKLTVSPETRNIPGGVIVKQGDIETNCSVDMLVQLRRNDLAGQVAEILFTA